MKAQTETTVEVLAREGYSNIRIVETRGFCGIMQFAFTAGLVYGLDKTGYAGRYCYPNRVEATKALTTWKGKGHPAGPWIKHKGKGIDESNPTRLSPAALTSGQKVIAESFANLPDHMATIKSAQKLSDDSGIPLNYLVALRTERSV